MRAHERFETQYYQRSRVIVGMSGGSKRGSCMHNDSVLDTSAVRAFDARVLRRAVATAGRTTIHRHKHLRVVVGKNGAPPFPGHTKPSVGAGQRVFTSSGSSQKKLPTRDSENKHRHSSLTSTDTQQSSEKLRHPPAPPRGSARCSFGAQYREGLSACRPFPPHPSAALCV